jgi:hypothetical protein
MAKTCALWLGLFCAIAVGIANAQTVTGSGGTLSAPKASGTGNFISVTGVTLSDGTTASLSCPITWFGAGPYALHWTCARGTLSYENGADTATNAQGFMTYTCIGGGRYIPVTCWHTFTGSATVNGAAQSIYIVAKGAVNNAPGTVTHFTITPD